MDEKKQHAGTTRYRVEIKVSEEQRELFTRAAAISKQGLSEFVRAAAERAARDVVAASKTHG